MRGGRAMNKVAYTRMLSNGELAGYNEEGVNFDDIPEVADFSKARRNPSIALRRKKGYTIIIEHEGYNEVREYDFAKIPKPSKGMPIPHEVSIVKR